MTKRKQKSKPTDEPEIYKPEIKHPPNLRTGLYGEPFVLLHKNLIQFMGLRNTVFLIGITDLYNYLRKARKVKNGRLFYGRELFQEKWGLSKYHQREAVEELSKCSLLRKVTGNVPHNWPILRINFVACYIFGLMISRIEKKEHLSVIWKMILDDKDLQKVIRKKIKRMACEWGNIKLDEFEWHVSKPKYIEDSYRDFAKIIQKAWNEMFHR